MACSIAGGRSRGGRPLWDWRSSLKDGDTKWLSRSRLPLLS